MTTYRYTLERQVGAFGGTKRGLFVMLNPSTADEMYDDPTIRRCKSFALREGWASFRVVNLFAARATNPTDLWAIPTREEAVGPENDVTLAREIGSADFTVAAWGALPRLGAARLVMCCEIEQFYMAGWLCLGVTKGGDPRHPLYVRGDVNLVPWDYDAWLKKWMRANA